MHKTLTAAGFMLIATGHALALPQQCPAEVKTQQRLSASVHGWQTRQNTFPHRLSHITIYDGPPEEMASLAPDSTRTFKGRQVSTWRFANPTDRRLWLVCGYAGTSLELTRDLPEKTRSCTLTTNPNIRLEGHPQIEKIDCK